MTQTQPVDVVIVGAGLCGLMAGAVLAERGLRLVLLDKGRSVGGRLATRRIGAGPTSPAPARSAA
ncbi:MAG TPA: NAD(P)-binding protein, partial [Caldilinea sp.]|nr:NAD(P)-binding protein [Caldilinea sp.]